MLRRAAGRQPSECDSGHAAILFPCWIVSARSDVDGYSMLGGLTPSRSPVYELDVVTQAVSSADTSWVLDAGRKKDVTLEKRTGREQEENK